MQSKGSRRILAQIEGTGAREAGWFVRGELPRELLEGAARRLGVLGLLTACSMLLFVLLYLPHNMTRYPSWSAGWLGILFSNAAILLSLAVFLVARVLRGRPRLLLGLGSVYQIAMALLIGLLAHVEPWESSLGARGAWSGVAVWIIIFSFMVPNTPRRTIWIASSAALMDPLALLVTVALGNPWPSGVMLLPLLGTVVLGVVTSVVASRINYRLGQRIQDAQQLGSYKLVQRLGRGGMGEVWRAQHKMLARPAAIKLIRADSLAGSDGAAAQSMVRRFEREAQATALLESEHTIELYDFGVATDGSFYYVMELLDGLDLELLVKRFGPLPPERAIHLLLQVCDSLAEAHESGLIHRDIKPSNIYVCRRARRYDYVKVLDFGLVKAVPGEGAGGRGETELTGEGSVTGTPAYMVPEIILGADHVDARADLYALGCVAYWLLSGKLVFEAPSAMKMVVSHASAEPPRLSERAQAAIPPALEQLVHDCLEKDPGRRPASAAELAARLERVELERAWTQERARQWWEAHAADLGGTPAAGAGVDPMAATISQDGIGGGGGGGAG